MSLGKRYGSIEDRNSDIESEIMKICSDRTLRGRRVEIAAENIHE